VLAGAVVAGKSANVCKHFLFFFLFFVRRQNKIFFFKSVEHVYEKLNSQMKTFLSYYKFKIIFINRLVYNDQHCLQWRTCQTESDVSAEIMFLKNTALPLHPQAIEAM
jgi:hypothetical protein